MKEVIQLLLAAIAFVLAIAVAAWVVFHSSARATPMHSRYSAATSPGLDKQGREIIDLVPLNPNYPKLRINAENPGHIVGKVVLHSRFLRNAEATP